MPNLTSSLQRSLAPAALIALAAVIAGIAGYLTAGSESAPPAPPPAIERPFLRGVVQSVAAGHLTLATENGPVEFRLAGDAPVETLRTTSIDRLTTGDWLNAGAVSHAQTLFALVGIVVIPSSQLQGPR